MAAKDKADEPAEVVTRERAEDAGPGKPVDGVTPSQMGATFAERAGGKAPKLAKQANTTFADRAKQVKPAAAEDKAVKSSQSKAAG